MNISDFFSKFVGCGSHFAETRKEHIRDYDEELPHVLMGELTHLLLDYPGNLDSQPLFGKDSFDCAISLICTAYERGDDALRNMLYVSFLENLETGRPGYHIIRESLRGTLRKDLDLEHDQNSPSN